MKVREVIRLLKDNGFDVDRQTGSHGQFEGFADGR